MKTYMIPFFGPPTGMIEIQANSYQEALEKAKGKEKPVGAKVHLMHKEST